ncbi:DUF4907 domain-containing protein [Proteiniphilum sp.]|uniref:DUF4907 domain-containing protein n=1 Tax=Proteiniphilum sp. TaxID=1926877 RepID=UPI003327DDD5
MTKKAATSGLSIISIILVVSVSFLFSVKSKDSGIYNVETFQSANGWGYQITQQGKVIILQSYIPCIKGDHPFPNEKSALETGNIVVAKIRNNEAPSITPEELDKTISSTGY